MCAIHTSEQVMSYLTAYHFERITAVGDNYISLLCCLLFLLLITIGLESLSPALRKCFCFIISEVAQHVLSHLWEAIITKCKSDRN